MDIVKNYKMGPIFTPPVLSKAEGPWATLVAVAVRLQLDGRLD